MQLGDRFSDALVFAAKIHAGQTRKLSGTPYVAHLLRVAGMALEQGADEDEAIAGLLHDAVEDQGGPAMRDEILRRFGPRVAEIVDGCTDTDQTPKPPWRHRKEVYLAHLRTASASVRLISTCDKVDNARSILAGYRDQGEALWEHFKGKREGTLWYYHSLIEILRQPPTTPLADELARTVAELERLLGEKR